jgi:hypothetical protein
MVRDRQTSDSECDLKIKDGKKYYHKFRYLKTATVYLPFIISTGGESYGMQ